MGVPEYGCGHNFFLCKVSDRESAPSASLRSLRTATALVDRATSRDPRGVRRVSGQLHAHSEQALDRDRSTSNARPSRMGGALMAIDIGITCGNCGRTEVDPDLVEVHVNQRDDFALFVVLCVTCGELVVGGDRDVIRQATAAGAREFELYSTERPPLTRDDLLALHEWLEAGPGSAPGRPRPLEADLS